MDPAPPFSEKLSVEELTSIYNDTQRSLFDRYRALFSLRNIGTEECVHVIGKGLNNPNFSELFQHEIAFVFGQMQEKAAAGVPYLANALHNTENHYIIRHEAAEAIGSVTDDPAALDIL